MDEKQPQAMDAVEAQPEQPLLQRARSTANENQAHRSLLMLSIAMMAIGSCGSPLLLRLYFLKGGRLKWLSAWLTSAAWPIMLAPLAASYHHRRKTSPTRRARPYLMTPPIFLACTVVGILAGLGGFLYAFGVAYLPVSVSSLLFSTQLGFTSLFAFLLVRQRFNSHSVNAVVLLSLAAVLLGINSSGDRPDGEGAGLFYAGFAMTLASAALYGLQNPMVEAVYARAERGVTYTLVTEVQVVTAAFATAFSTVGMLVNNDFQAMAREAKEFELGEARYYVLLISTAILWQLCSIGVLGAIFYASAFVTGIINAALLPVVELLAVIFFHESFSGNKGVVLGLSLWGFAFYFYGEFKEHKEKKISTGTNPG